MDAPSRRNNSRSSRNTNTKTSPPPPPPPDNSKMGAERSVRNLKITKALTMKEGTSVFDVCKRMGTRKVVAALLIDSSSTLSGIITDKDVATKVVAGGLDARDTPASMVMTRNPQHVTIDTNAIEALDKMIQGKFRHLPVVENGEVVGLLDITKCLYDAISKMENAAEKGSAIAAAVEGVERQYGDVRSDFVETLRERMFRPTLSTIISDATKAVIVALDDSVFLAAKRMRDNGVSSVIIMSGQKLHGILTSKDLLSRVLLQNLPAESTTIEKVMTKNPKCVTSSTKLLDALRIMHDGNFLHLPVVDSVDAESSILGCVDVLQLTHAAMALFGNSSVNENEMSTSMMQKFWDSTIALGLPETEDDSLSDACLSLASEMTGYQSLAMGDVFTFKMWDMMGRVHRFTSGIKSLSELISAVVQRIGDSTDDNCKPQIMYEDDEGDKVLLSTDNDLSTAVCHARMAGWKALKLHVYNRQSVASKDNGSLEPVPSTQVQNQNKSVRYPLVILGMVLLVGISVTMYKRRSS